MATSQDELSSKEKELFRYTQEQNYDEVKRLITEEGNIHVDCMDSDGMTPLQHAAYKGNYKLCKLLLDCGADVNLTKHVSRYSALTFASLSGKEDVVCLLLDHGALTTTVNSINKTAAQMAAFVGNHHIVSIINNYIPIQEIEYFNKIQGLEKEPKLPVTLTPIVHKMAIMTNINPVRLAMYIQNNPIVLENLRKVSRVFNILAEKYYREESNQLLSLKFHHEAYVLSACEKYYIEYKSKDEGRGKTVKECLIPFIKHLINGFTSGFPMNLEKFLRQDIREYPFIDCSLFQQLVRALSPVELGQEPSAISIIMEAVNGHRGGDSYTFCCTCGDLNAEKKCAMCKSAIYCDKTCQKLHWFTHKSFCGMYAKLNESVGYLSDDVYRLSIVHDEKDKGSDKPGCSKK